MQERTETERDMSNNEKDTGTYVIHQNGKGAEEMKLQRREAAAR